MIAGKPIWNLGIDTSRQVNELYFAQIDGNKVFRMGEVKEISVEIKSPSADETPDMSLNLSGQNFSATIGLDKPLTAIQYAKIFGLRVVVLPKSFMCETIGFEQKRHHRKKRIDKKWRKRYGMKPVYGPEKEAYIQQSARGRDALYVGPDTWEEIKDLFYCGWV